jgi:hypothetical protein
MSWKTSRLDTFPPGCSQRAGIKSKDITRGTRKVRKGEEEEDESMLCWHVVRLRLHTSNHEFLIVASGLAFDALDKILLDNPLEFLVNCVHELRVPVTSNNALNE